MTQIVHVAIRLAAVLVLCAGAGCGVIAEAPRSGGAAAETEVVIETDAGEARFTVELARSAEEKRVGLMHRKSLPAEAGMLFDFGPEPRVASMWMRNTFIPLDMAFIDAAGVIVTIAEETTPLSLESISSGAPVVAVLEVNGGAFAARGVAVGDRVRHPWFAGAP
ncbi:MAG: DUF192 domain-containing protein [Pseudomonadota bacterium]